jgi:hypothetical protein
LFMVAYVMIVLQKEMALFDVEEQARRAAADTQINLRRTSQPMRMETPDSAKRAAFAHAH